MEEIRRRAHDRTNSKTYTEDIDYLLSLLQPPAASERCVECGHGDGVGEDGVCKSTDYDPNKTSCLCHGCLCKCVFATTGPTGLAERVLEAVDDYDRMGGIADYSAFVDKYGIEKLSLIDAIRAVVATTRQGVEQWVTCAECGKQRDSSTLANGRNSFVCRYCLSTEAVPAPAATTTRDAGEGRQDECEHGTQRGIACTFCDELDQQPRPVTDGAGARAAALEIAEWLRTGDGEVDGNAIKEVADIIAAEFGGGEGGRRD